MELEHKLSDAEKRVAEANAKSNLSNSNSHSHSNTKNKDSVTQVPRYPFVIMDRLVGTLCDKLQQWESKHRKMSSLVGKMITHRHHSKATFCFMERMTVLCDMASALAYLHRQR